MSQPSKVDGSLVPGSTSSLLSQSSPVSPQVSISPRIDIGERISQVSSVSVSAAPLRQRSVTDLNVGSGGKSADDSETCCLSLPVWKKIAESQELDKDIVLGNFVDKVLLADDVLLLVTKNNELQRWDLREAKLLTQYKLEKVTPGFCPILLKNGHVIYTNTANQLCRFDSVTGKILETHDGHSWNYRQKVLLPEEILVIITEESNSESYNRYKLERWDLKEGKLLTRHSLLGYVAPILLGNGFAIGQTEVDGPLCVFDSTEQGKVVKVLEKIPRYYLNSLLPLFDNVFLIVISSYFEGSGYYPGTVLKEIQIWDTDSDLRRGSWEIFDIDKVWNILGRIRAIREEATKYPGRSYGDGLYVQETELRSHPVPETVQYLHGRLIVRYGNGSERDFWKGENPFGQDSLTDGKMVSYTVDKAGEITAQLWQTKKQKLLTFLKTAVQDKLLGFSEEVSNILTIADLDALLTLCEETEVVKGVDLPETLSTPLSRTRVHYLNSGLRLTSLTRKEQASVQVPDDFICPITCQIMLDPVIAADGESYERTAIAQWSSIHQTSPKHNTVLEHSQLIPNRNLSRSINEFLGKNSFLFEENNGTGHTVYVKDVLQKLEEFFNTKDEARLQRLLERYPQLALCPIGSDMTVLHRACSQNSVEVLRAVLKGSGKYILPILKHHNIDIFFRMTAKAMGVEGTRCFGEATFWKEVDFIQMSLRAIEEGDTKILDICLSLGVSVNTVDKRDRNTFLHFAVISNKEEIVCLLINRGADIYRKNSAHQTPSKLAYQLQYQHLIKAIKDTHLRFTVSGAESFIQRDAEIHALVVQNRDLKEQVAVLQNQMAELLKHRHAATTASSTLVLK